MIGKSTLSAREKLNPGTIKRLTRSMEVCHSCGEMFRRMCTDWRVFCCGRCGIPDVANPSAIPYGDASSSRKD